MKFVVIVFAALIAVAIARPDDASILRFNSDVKADGYTFDVETSDGFKQQEHGELHNAGAEHETIEVKGSYSYVGDDGKTYTVNYVADEHGYQPIGDHLPVNGIH